MFGSSGPITKLWVEKYRPSSVNDYVFKNEALKLKVNEWIRTGELPSILFHGPAGTGKCQTGDTVINVQFDINNMSVEQVCRMREILSKNL